MIELREYQKQAINACYDYMRKSTGNGCIVLPTGSGKSVVLAQICSDAVSLWDGRVLVLTHVQELIEQNAGKIKHFLGDNFVGIYSAGLKQKDMHQPVIAASIQSIYKKAFEFEPFDLIIIDECFPKGTLISTPRGEIDIEKLHVGQPVHTALGIGEIECISARNTHRLIKLELNNGTAIISTPNHPFFTENGWQQAKTVGIGTTLYSKKDMCMLREYIYTLGKEESGWINQEFHEGISVEKAAFLFDLLLEEGGKSNVAAGYSGENDCNAQENREKTHKSRRQRKVDNSAIENAGTARKRMDCRVCCNNAKAEAQGNTAKLQDRYCQSEPENSDRNRWQLSYPIQSSQSGPKANQLLAQLRVERITYIECESPTAVFNLQIKGHPSYYANGVLVHNCHLIPQQGEGMYLSFLRDAKIVNPNIRIVGCTATPYRTGTGMICGTDNILNEICYEIGIKELIRDGFLSPLRSKASKTRIDTSGLHVRGGEFISNELEDLMDTDARVKAACSEILEYTQDRFAVLIFAAGVEHGKHIQRIFQENHNIECGFVSGDSPDGWRRKMIDDFRSGKLKYLCNVNVLTTGFDAPNIDCIAMLRPTMSPGLYYQMTGRGFRLHENKKDCLVLDFGGNILRHGPVDCLRVTDAAIKGNGDAPAKECPECCEIIHAAYARCPSCGYEFPPPEKTKHESTASTEGILSDQASVNEYPVEEVLYNVHTKKSAKTESPRTMRVQYKIGFGSYISEWICFEHSGFARHKAEIWWKQRSDSPVPDDSEMAAFFATNGRLKEPVKISVKHIPGQKFDNIVSYQFDNPELSEWQFDKNIPDYVPVDDEIPF